MSTSFNKEIASTKAFAKVTTSELGALTVLNNRGFSSITRTGSGVYTFVLEGAVPTDGSVASGAGLSPSETLVQLTRQGAVAGSISSQDTNPTTTTVTSFDSTGSAADADFTIELRCPTNQTP